MNGYDVTINFVGLQKDSQLSVCGNGTMYRRCSHVVVYKTWLSCAKLCSQNKWFACTLLLNESSFITLKTFAIRDFSTESKQFVESNDNLFSSLKVEANTFICGFTCKRVQNWACVEMLRSVRWGNPFLVYKICHRVHPTTEKFHWVWKKATPKQTICLNEDMNMSLIPS